MNIDTLRKINKSLPTPAYVFDIDVLKSRLSMIRNGLKGKADVAYAMKANPFLVRELKDSADKLEVCSPGEYEICHRYMADPSKIIVSGVNKTKASMDRILDLSTGRGIFTLESPQHYHILSTLCAEKKLHIKVLLRLSSGNQFGMDKELLEETLTQVLSDPNMDFYGIHYYSGTQKKMKKVVKELTMLNDYASYLHSSFDTEVHELEYGPGLSFTYFEKDEPVDGAAEVAALSEALDIITEFSHITLEMGRFLASSCGSYFTKIVDMKSSDGVNYAIVDGGIHQLNYYGQIMGMKKPFMQLLFAESSDSRGEACDLTICGSLCTVNDVILKATPFPRMQVGDTFVFENCGAYSVTEGMALFLSRELPTLAFYKEKDGLTIVREKCETNTFNS